MSENLIASLLVGRNTTSSMPIEEYKARKVALVTGKFVYFPLVALSPFYLHCLRKL